MCSRDKAVISISISVGKIFSSNQRALYDYVDHVPIEHNTDIRKSFRRVLELVLISQLSPTAHKLPVPMLWLQVSSRIYYVRKASPMSSHGSSALYRVWQSSGQVSEERQMFLIFFFKGLSSAFSYMKIEISVGWRRTVAGLFTFISIYISVRYLS